VTLCLRYAGRPSRLRRSRHFAVRSVQNVMSIGLINGVNRGTTRRRDRGGTGPTLRS
jgi:predicted transcriptional regulator